MTNIAPYLGEVVAHASRSTDTANYAQWLTPSFQSLWWNELPSGGAFRRSIQIGALSAATDTTPDFSLAAFGSRTASTVRLVRSIADVLSANVRSMTQWAEDREYEEQFVDVIEPAPGLWLKNLSRFGAGPEISVPWDEDDE